MSLKLFAIYQISACNPANLMAKLIYRNEQPNKELPMKTYTIAIRNVMPHGPAYSPADGIPRNLTLIQAEKLAKQARFKGVDCVAFNVASV